MYAFRGITFLVLCSTASKLGQNMLLPNQTHEHHHPSSVARCLAELANENFHNMGKTLYVSVSQHLKKPDEEFPVDELLKRLHEKGRWNLITSVGKVKFSKPPRLHCGRKACGEIIPKRLKTGYYVVIVENWRQFSVILKRLRAFQNFNPRAKYATYLASHSDQKSSARKILETYRRHNIFRSLIVAPRKNSRQCEIFGLDTFARSEMCGASSRLVLAGECREGALKGGATLYDHVTAPKLNGCFLNVITMRHFPFVMGERTGFEMRVLHQIAEKINVSLKVNVNKAVEEWEKKDADDHWIGKLAYIKNNFSIGIGSIRANKRIYEDFDVTADYFYDELVWVVPKARKAPQWKRIVVIFSREVWLINLALLLVCGTSICFLARTETSPNDFKSPGYSLLVSLQVLVGNAVHRKPKADLKRAVLVSLSLYGIMICCAYQSFLIEILTHPLYKRQISTERDILDSNLTIAGVENYRSIFRSTEDQTSLEIYDRYRTFPDDLPTRKKLMQDVKVYRNVCTISGKIHLMYLLSHRFPSVTRNGRPAIHILTKQLFTYPITMVMPKKFFLRDVFNDLINRFLASGLTNKWMEKYMFEYKRRHRRGTVRLSLDNVQGAFALLIVGYVLGSVSFVAEIFLSKATSDRRLA